ncbi:MAG: T9SS type A sorting domain-containing protein, partial [Chitinophagaceae bacterium]
FSCNLQPYRFNKMVMFRIKQTNADGMIKYSNVLILDLKTSTLPYLRIYPNPITSYAQIRVDEDRYSSWQVDLFSLRGERVRQENFASTRAFQLRNLDQLPKGMYILKLTNKDTRKTYQEKILLQ